MNELLSLNSSLLTNVYTKHVNGREYVVAEAIVLREGVLHGSDGPLYYPLNEISKSVGVWNGFPIVAPHPYVWVNGEMKHVSASHSPEIRDQFSVGTVYNDRMCKDEKGLPVRKLDLYFDVENSNRVDGRIIPAIRSGERVNVSTGIFTEKKQAVDNSSYNGTRYTHTVHNIAPDHLAVLMDEKGACSVFDGCGINVNSQDVLGKWSLEDIQAVVTYNRDWPKSKRESLSKSAPDDFAGPHQSFPIKTQEDVNSAAKLTGHADDPASVKSKIKSIAKRKGLKVPDSWATNEGVSGGEEETRTSTINDDKTLTDNVWTQAARTASVNARRMTHDTLDKSKIGKAGLIGKNHLANLAKHADKAVAQNINGDSKGAIASHKEARDLHTAIAKQALSSGDHHTASLHNDAAAGHNHAMGMYGKGSTRNSDTKGTKMEDKAELVSWLTTNCDCWKGKKDSETVLNTLSDEQLKQLKVNAVKAHYTDTATKIVKDVGSKVGFKGNFNLLPEFITNSIAVNNAKKKKESPKKNPMDDEDEDDVNNELTGLASDSEIFSDSGTPFKDESVGLEDFTPIGSKGTRGQNMTKGRLTKGGGSELPESGQLGVMNKETILNALKGMSEEEYLSVAPASVKQVLNQGKEILKEKKVVLINQLTANITDEKVRKQKILNLWKKSIPQLQEILEYSGITNTSATVPAQDTDQQILTNFFGQNGAPANNGSNRPVINTKDVLMPYLDVFSTEETQAS